MAAFGSPFFDRRMKYGLELSGPVLVTVQFLMLRWKSSAAAWYTAASAASPCCLAIALAAVRPAISAAIVETEYPDCSSQRSTPKDGPCAIRKSAAGLMWPDQRAESPPRPDRYAIRIGYAVSSSWSPPVSGAAWPLTSELRGISPVERCWSSSRNRVAARAVERSPSASSPVNASYRSRAKTSR